LMFHYFYEDLKLNKFMFAAHGLRLCNFQIKLILSMKENLKSAEYLFVENKNSSSLKKMSYVMHYVGDFPSLKFKYAQDLQEINKIIENQIMLE